MIQEIARFRTRGGEREGRGEGRLPNDRLFYERQEAARNGNRALWAVGMDPRIDSRLQGEGGG